MQSLEVSEGHDDIHSRTSEKPSNLQQDKILSNNEVARSKKEDKKFGLNGSLHEFALEVKKFIKFIGPGYREHSFFFHFFFLLIKSG